MRITTTLQGAAMPIQIFRRLFVRALTVVAATSAIAAPAVAGGPSGVGLNLSSWNYYATDFPIIDQFKRAGGWYTQCDPSKDASCKDFTGGASPWDTLEESKLQLDANGWVTSLPAPDDPNVKYRFVSALLFSGNDGRHPAGEYTVLYDGSGKIEYALLGSLVSHAEGRDVVNVKNGTGDGWLVSIKQTTLGNPIRNIRILPPGGVCENAPKDYAANADECAARGTGAFIKFEDLPKQVWHPYYLSELRGFRTLRFMDWGRTNDSLLARWADRPLPSHAFWSGPYGVPVESMVDLANTAGADPWINLPAHVDDDYVRNFAQRVKATMSTKRTLILEYGNEPWNYQFAATGWMQNNGAAQWSDPKYDKYTVYTKRNNWYAMRAMQVCSLVKAEFGADASRVRCVLNAQASVADVAAEELDCVLAKEVLGAPCGQLVDALAIAPYFGHYIASLDPLVRDEVDRWTYEPDGGLNKLFEELLGMDASGNKVTPPLFGKAPESIQGGAVELSKRWMSANMAQAARYARPMWAYEGGQHLIMGSATDNDERWLALLIAGNRDPRMADAYDRMLKNWRTVGGQTMTYFNHIGVPS